MSKATWSTIFLIVSLLAVALYHTGVKAENDCLERGNSATQCARLVM